MYGVIGHVELDPARQDEAEQMLHDEVIPMVKGIPGFVSGYWLRSDDGTSGMSLMLFETEEQAKNVIANRPDPPAGGPIKGMQMEVRRVLAQA